MTTNGEPPPARVQLTLGSCVMRTDLSAVRAESGDGRADPGVVRGKLRGMGGDLDLMRGEFDGMRERFDVPPVRRGWEMPLAS